jgi:hypothetical protein
MFPQSKQEHRMQVRQYPDGSDGGVFLFVHDVINCGDHEFGENFDDEFGFEVFCGVCHYHGETSLEEVKETLLIVLLAEVDWDPVGDAFVVGGEFH